MVSMPRRHVVKQAEVRVLLLHQSVYAAGIFVGDGTGGVSGTLLQQAAAKVVLANLERVQRHFSFSGWQQCKALRLNGAQRSRRVSAT